MTDHFIYIPIMSAPQLCFLPWILVIFSGFISVAVQVSCKNKKEEKRKEKRREKRRVFPFHSLQGFPVLFYGGHAAGRRPPVSVYNVDRGPLVHSRNTSHRG